MKMRFGNRVLTWALAISLALHLTLAVVMHNVHRVEAAPEQRPTHVVIIEHFHTPPPPTPTPAPTQPPKRTVVIQLHAVPAPHVHFNAPHVGGTGPSHGHPIAMATSGPDVPGDSNAPPGSPAPSPHPACSIPDAPARAIAAAMPETPDDATGLPATAEVKVTLDPAGHVAGAEIYRSTGELALDRAALVAARSSSYAPAIAACLPVGGSYLFRVDFAE